MDDINFDELDKAVNSALQQSTPKTRPAQDQPLSLPSEQDTSSEPPQTVPQTVTKEPVIQTVPQKPRGQFMDMVHPSSDMIKPVSVRPSRQGATIQPLSPSIVNTPQPEAIQPESNQIPPREVPAEVTTFEESDDDKTESLGKSEWPDPLDVMEQTEQEKQEDTTPSTFDESTSFTSDIAENEENVVTETTEAELENQEVDSISDSIEPESHEVPESPFISGADPEKRPLGAFAGTPTVSEEVASGAENEPPHVDETNSAATEEDIREELPIVPLPQELTPEVISVESDDSLQTADGLQESSATNEPEPEIPDANGATTSIAPQYRHADAPSDDQGDHPVFDTKDYHQPLTPPAKHSHAGLIVFLVTVILALLGASAWYAIAILKLI